MTFSELYSNKIIEKVNSESSNCKNQIFVIIGQTELIKNGRIEEGIVDIDTFRLNGNDSIFNKVWFAKIFSLLNTETDFHILSYPQFSYLIYYIDSSFFKERVIFLKDNLRQLFPIDRNEFLEKSEEESIEQRPNNIPIYQAEQLQINNSFYYSVKMPSENFKSFDIFTDKSELLSTIENNLETIDVSSDPYAMDYFINSCIQKNVLNLRANVKQYSKQPTSSTIKERILIVNNLLNLFGGGLYSKDEEVIKASYEPNQETQNLLNRYWGDNAEFRKMQVYENPDFGNQITEISQGLIVDTIISEYKNSKKNERARDLFLTAPTGAGKSLLFQLPSFYVSQNGDVTIVVSPLIALMKDQVNAIIQDRNFEKVAYINSELSLINRDRIIEYCKNGDIDILYMSPELLMSYDISHFIGQRTLGLLVIDEAHLITTWGRDFRVDYWFLGNHIRKIRKYHSMNFPMVAVTATAIYGGANDMVFDSLDSLLMHNPHIFIGQVKRDDIKFLVNNYEKFEGNYEKSKLEQTVQFIKDINDLKIKTLVYTPYTKHIRQILAELSSKHLDIATGYYGSLPADQKELSFRQFKNGERKIMISTKAFGMGIDISDIKVVYHHAPSGLLPDYVQEIGRVARKPSLKGIAALNYASQDQRFTKALHGMSALRQYQIKEVLKKITRAYIKNDKSRNLLLSVDDFGHIFENAPDLDQKVLTSLMMIEKDYLAKHRFNVLIARPKKLFVKVYARISENHLDLFAKKYYDTFRQILSKENGYNIIEVDLDKLWFQNFKDISFPVLKYKYYTGKLFKDENIELIPQLKISFERLNNFDKIYDDLNNLFENIKSGFAQFSGSFFTEKEFEDTLDNFIQDSTKSKKISKFILSSYSGRVIGPGIIQGNAFLAHRKTKGGYQYRVFSNQYLANFSSLLRRLNGLFGNTDSFIVERFVTNKESNTENYIRLGYFLEILELGTFEIKGGENPMVFIRINDPERIARDSNNDNYSNTLLSKTLERHYLSNQIFDHFFLRSFSNEERWNFIEDYFLGSDVDTLINTFKGGDSNKLNIIECLKEYEPLNSVSTKSNNNSNIHIFQAKPETFYKGSDLLTIDNENGPRTMKVLKWLTTDPIIFDQARKKHNFKVDHKVFEILVSKLKNNHFEYFKESLGLDMRIDFKDYDKPVKAIVPYKNQPVEFYKWWCENQEKISLKFKDKLILINEVNLTKPEILKSKHRKLIKK